jgi:hypothetical protein
MRSGVDAVDRGGHLGYVYFKVGAGHGGVADAGFVDEAMGAEAVVRREFAVRCEGNAVVGFGRYAVVADRQGLAGVGAGDDAVMMQGGSEHWNGRYSQHGGDGPFDEGGLEHVFLLLGQYDDPCDTARGMSLIGLRGGLRIRKSLKKVLFLGVKKTKRIFGCGFCDGGDAWARMR